MLATELESPWDLALSCGHIAGNMVVHLASLVLLNNDKCKGLLFYKPHHPMFQVQEDSVAQWKANMASSDVVVSLMLVKLQGRSPRTPSRNE